MIADWSNDAAEELLNPVAPACSLYVGFVRLETVIVSYVRIETESLILVGMTRPYVVRIEACFFFLNITVHWHSAPFSSFHIWPNIYVLSIFDEAHS